MRDVGVRKAFGLVAGVVAVGLASTTACTNLQDVVQAKGEGAGTAAVYPVTERQAWQITNAVLELKHATPAPREWRGEGYVLQSIQMSPLSSGTFIGVWVEPVGPDRTKVTFLRKRKGTADTVRALTDREFHHDFTTLMGLLAASCTAPPGASGAVPPGASTGALPAESSAGSTQAPGASAPVPGAPVAEAPSASVAPPVGSASQPTSSATGGASAKPATPSGPPIREIPLPPSRTVGRTSTQPVGSAPPAPAGSAEKPQESGIREVPLPPQRVR